VLHEETDQTLLLLPAMSGLSVGRHLQQQPRILRCIGAIGRRGRKGACCNSSPPCLSGGSSRM